MRWVLTQHCSCAAGIRHSSGKLQRHLERTVRELNGESWDIPGRSTTGKTADRLVVALFGEPIHTKMPCTRLSFSMQSGPQRNYVGSVICLQVATFIRTSPFAVKAPGHSNAAVEKVSISHTGQPQHHRRQHAER